MALANGDRGDRAASGTQRSSETPVERSIPQLMTQIVADEEWSSIVRDDLHRGLGVLAWFFSFPFFNLPAPLSSS